MSVENYVDIEKIINSESLILVDGSVFCQQNICRDIYDAKLYTQLDAGKIRRAISSMRHLENLLHCRHAYTICDVTKEIKEFERIINDKIKGMALFNEMSYSGKYRKSKRLRNLNAIKERGEMARDLLYTLQQKAYSRRKLSEHREIDRFPEFRNINDLVYESLLDMTKLISNEIGLKEDTSYLMGEREDKKEYSDTDEKLAAMVYRLCLDNKNCCLLSRDCDLIRILGVATRILGSKIFLPYNEIFREKVMQNPFRLYFKHQHQNKFELVINSLNTNFQEDFTIKSGDEKRKLEIVGMFVKHWQEISNNFLTSV
jgi:hypothetical protein